MAQWVLMSSNTLDSLTETLAVLSDHEAMEQLAEANRAVVEGDVIRGVDAVWALRPS